MMLIDGRKGDVMDGRKGDVIDGRKGYMIDGRKGYVIDGDEIRCDGPFKMNVHGAALIYLSCLFNHPTTTNVPRQLLATL